MKIFLKLLIAVSFLFLTSCSTLVMKKSTDKVITADQHKFYSDLVKILVVSKKKKFVKFSVDNIGKFLLLYKHDVTQKWLDLDYKKLLTPADKKVKADADKPNASKAK